jgi:hypothetical protein
MSQARIFPFRRVSVDHMVRGVSRVWWQLEKLFKEPGPYVFQLQFGRTGLRDATDWVDVGAPVTNGYFAYDSAWREAGYTLMTHYRVKLTTPQNVYVSQAANVFGELTTRDWTLAREIIRKEELRHKLVSIPGYLIKPMRYGVPCPRCRDELSSEVTDANCPVCNGTGFEVGYHPAQAMQCWDLSPQNEQSDVGEPKGTTRENPYVDARVIGFPGLNKDDIWVNGSSDERWVVETIQVAAALRGVPIVYQVRMGLIPFSNTIYAVEIGGEPSTRTGPALPMLGCGAIPVDHDYGGQDELAYTLAGGCGVVGADVYVFRKVVFDAGGLNVNRTLALAKTTTRVNGRWTRSVRLDAGDYVVLFEKPGEYGPDTKNVTVTIPPELLVPTYVPQFPLGETNEDGDPSFLKTEDDNFVSTPESGVVYTVQPQIDPDEDFWKI